MWHIWKTRCALVFQHIKRNPIGDLLAAKTISTTTRDIDQAEALAVLESLKWACQMQCKKLLVQTDNKGVDDAVTRLNFCCRRENIYLINHIRDMLSSFYSCNVIYISRDCNLPSDALAKYARKHMCNSVWYVTPPNIIRNQTEADFVLLFI